MNLPINLTVRRDKATGKPIILVDASGYKDTACSRALLYRIGLGFRRGGSGSKNHKMAFGSAFHKAMEVWYGSTKDSAAQMAATQAALDFYKDIEVPDGDFRTLANLGTVVMSYCMRYGAGDPLQVVRAADGAPLIEKYFQLPLYSTPAYDLLICGTIDLIARFQGQLVICDHKTTAIAASKADYYLNDYLLSHQLMLYTSTVREFLPEATRDNLCAMINGVFLERSGAATFKRSSVFRYTAEQVEDLREQIKETMIPFCEKIARFDGNITPFRHNYSACKKAFGACDYFLACSCGTTADELDVLMSSFTQATYDPSKFGTNAED